MSPQELWRIKQLEYAKQVLHQKVSQYSHEVSKYAKWAEASPKEDEQLTFRELSGLYRSMLLDAWEAYQYVAEYAKPQS